MHVTGANWERLAPNLSMSLEKEESHPWQDC